MLACLITVMSTLPAVTFLQTDRLIDLLLACLTAVGGLQEYDLHLQSVHPLHVSKSHLRLLVFVCGVLKGRGLLAVRWFMLKHLNQPEGGQTLTSTSKATVRASLH